MPFVTRNTDSPRPRILFDVPMYVYKTAAVLSFIFSFCAVAYAFPLLHVLTYSTRIGGTPIAAGITYAVCHTVSFMMFRRHKIGKEAMPEMLLGPAFVVFMQWMILLAIQSDNVAKLASTPVVLLAASIVFVLQFAFVPLVNRLMK